MKENKILDSCMSCSSGDSRIPRRLFNFSIFLTSLLFPIRSISSKYKDIIEQVVSIETDDGICDAVLFYPKEGKFPPALIWTDIRGLRQSFKFMGKRLASQGYVVLIPNPFYRSSPAPAPREGFNYFDLEQRKKVFSMMKLLIAKGAAERDTSSFVKFLKNHASVDNSKKMGVSGYCMGGPLAFRSASHFPNFISAVGSFHAGGLVTKDKDSPHILIKKSKSRFYVAIASDDDQKNPNEKDQLRKSFNEASLEAEIKVYDKMRHGWCVSDSSVYNDAKAEAAWRDLVDMYNDVL